MLVATVCCHVGTSYRTCSISLRKVIYYVVSKPVIIRRRKHCGCLTCPIRSTAVAVLGISQGTPQQCIALCILVLKYYYVAVLLFAGLCYSCIGKCDTLPLSLLYILDFRVWDWHNFRIIGTCFWWVGVGNNSGSIFNFRGVGHDRS